MYSGKKVQFSPVHKDATTWEVHLSGIDLGGKTTLHSLQKGGLWVVVKVGGHSAWTGLGMEPHYVPASFMLFEMEEAVLLDEVYPTHYKLKSFIVEFPVRGYKA
jgi:hypothetical protein